MANNVKLYIVIGSILLSLLLVLTLLLTGGKEEKEEIKGSTQRVTEEINQLNQSIVNLYKVDSYQQEIALDEFISKYSTQFRGNTLDNFTMQGVKGKPYTAGVLHSEDIDTSRYRIYQGISDVGDVSIIHGYITLLSGEKVHHATVIQYTPSGEVERYTVKLLDRMEEIE